MSDSVRPHRRQPTRLPRLWDSPGKNTGMGCHFLLQCMKVKSQREVAQSYLTLSDPMDCSLPGSFVHRIFQARVLEWGAIAINMSVNLENSAVATGMEKVSFHSNPKEGQCQRIFNHCTKAFISHVSKVMLQILQARLQQYVN